MTGRLVLLLAAIGSLVFAHAATTRGADVNYEPISFRDDETVIASPSDEVVTEDEVLPAETFYFDEGLASRWTVWAGAITLHRSRLGSSGAIYIPDSAPLDTNQLDMGWRVGPDLRAVYRFRQRRYGFDEIGVRWFSVWNWSATQSRSGMFLGGGDEVPIFYGLGTTYSSSLHSFEINARRRQNGWLTLLAGFRYLELNEGSSQWVTLTDLIDRASYVFNTATANHLYGFQVGGVANLWDRGGRFTLNSWTKAGIYANSAQSSVFAVASNDGEGASGFAKTTNTKAAFVGDFTLMANYRLTNRLSIYAGYQLLLVDGVALAPQQSSLFYFDSSVINFNGSPFYHGGMLGMRADF